MYEYFRLKRILHRIQRMNEIEICIITMRIDIILRRINIHLMVIISRYLECC